MTVPLAIALLNHVLFMFYWGFGLDEIHKFPNGYPTIFPAGYEPSFPRFNIGTAKLIFVVVINFSNRGRCDASAGPDSTLLAPILGRTRYG